MGEGLGRRELGMVGIDSPFPLYRDVCGPWKGLC